MLILLLKVCLLVRNGIDLLHELFIVAESTLASIAFEIQKFEKLKPDEVRI